MLIRIQEDSLRINDNTLILIPHFKERIIRLILQGIDGFPKEFEVATKTYIENKNKTYKISERKTNQDRILKTSQERC